MRNEKTVQVKNKEVVMASRKLRKAAPLFFHGIFLASALAGVCVANREAENAKEIALQEVGLKSEDVTFARPVSEKRDGQRVLKIGFTDAKGTKYEFNINEKTGDIVDMQQWEPA